MTKFHISQQTTGIRTKTKNQEASQATENIPKMY